MSSLGVPICEQFGRISKGKVTNIEKTNNICDATSTVRIHIGNHCDVKLG